MQGFTHGVGTGCLRFEGTLMRSRKIFPDSFPARCFPQVRRSLGFRRLFLLESLKPFRTVRTAGPTGLALRVFVNRKLREFRPHLFPSLSGLGKTAERKH